MGRSDYQPVHEAGDAGEDGRKRAGSTSKTSLDGEGKAVEEAATHDRDGDALLPEERCCWGALQCLARPYLFCVLICACCMFYGAAYVATGGGVLTTIEKRFQLKTSELATFLVVNDVISVLMIVFVSYYGHTSHRPRLIGGGTMLVGLGFFLCAMPHFLYDAPPQFALDAAPAAGPPSPASATSASASDATVPPPQDAVYPVCRGLNASADGHAAGDVCTAAEEEESGALMRQVAWIIGGRILIGVGTSPLTPLALTYIDDCIDKSFTSVVLSCIFVAGSVGPFLGYVISSYSLSKHADFYKGNGAADVREGDPNWLGAWWLSYVITGSVMMLCGLPIALFPKKIRRRADGGAAADDGVVKGSEAAGVDDLRAVERREEEEEEEEVTDKGICAYITGFLGAMRRLVTNGPYVALALGECAVTASVVATIAFLAKYLETQFSLPASATPLLNSVIFTPGWVAGSLLGGMVVKRLKLGNKGMARMILLLKPFTLVLLPVLLFLGCENPPMAGLTATYAAAGGGPHEVSNDLWAACNSDCACPDDYAPVCGSDGLTYATPCHAGCQASPAVTPSTDGARNITVFAQCSCIVGGQNNTFGLSGDYDNMATMGACESECNTLIPFVVVTAVVTFLSSLNGIPTYMLKFRIVAEGDRSVALGFTAFLERLLATIPAPILFGAVIQMTCLLLQSSCGYTGNCLVYDIVYFRRAFFGLALGLDVASAVMFALCYALIKQPRHEELQDMDKEWAAEDEKTSGSQTADQNANDPPHETVV